MGLSRINSSFLPLSFSYLICWFLFFSLALATSGCSLLSRTKKGGEVRPEKVTYDYRDGTGNYRLIKEVGQGVKDHVVFVKTKLLPPNEDERSMLESSVVLSKMGQLKVGDEKIDILKPQISQYTVWLDGKKYFSQLHFDAKEKQIKVVSFDPQTENYQRKSINIPVTQQIYCFYSQLIECIRYTGFLKKAKEKKAGRMSLQILWDPYPYMKDQYQNIEDAVLTPAIFAYEGELSGGLSSYALNFNAQSISFQFDKEENLVKKLWIAQGISQEKEGFVGGSEENENGENGEDKDMKSMESEGEKSDKKS